MSGLFNGDGNDPAFLALRDEDSYAKERAECERLWLPFKEIREKDFTHEFSRNFQHRFWEMWLGAQLNELSGKVARQSSGPDFEVKSEPIVHVEASVVERGKGNSRVPKPSERDDDDDSVLFRECVLRITEKLQEKRKRNNAEQIGNAHPYILAVNLPFPEAWVSSTPPLAAQAFLGAGGHYAVKQSDGSWQGAIAWKPNLENHNKSKVETTAFLDGTYRWVSAIIIASVNVLSSCYPNPALELLHNPTAIHPVPRGWFRFGHEYWLEDGALRCQSHPNV